MRQDWSPEAPYISGNLAIHTRHYVLGTVLGLGNSSWEPQSLSPGVPSCLVGTDKNQSPLDRQ